jgi:hypothetical protein
VTFTGTPAKIVSSMARMPAPVPGILMKRLGRCASMKSRGAGDGAGGVVRQQRRPLERYPTVDAAAGVVDRSKEIRGPCQILQRQFEERGLARLARGGFLMDGVVIEAPVFDRLIEMVGLEVRPVTEYSAM